MAILILGTYMLTNTLYDVTKILARDGNIHNYP